MTTHYVAEEEDIPVGGSRLVTIEGKEIGIFRERDGFYAVLNVCPHMRAPVCLGRVEGTMEAPTPATLDYNHERRVLRCPWHHWEFELDTGKAVCRSVRQRLKTYPVRLEDRKIFVEL